MSLQYSHLLIPYTADFVPQPSRVAAFLEGLARLDSAPLNATFTVGKQTGRIRTGTDPITGEKISVPVRDFGSVGSISDIPEQLTGLDDYDVIMSGQGPAKIPPFALYAITQSEVSEFKEEYAYEVRCCLRADVVSTCETPPFGSPCESGRRSGIFHHPSTGAIIQVPKAACARFWIEFQFGKWLLPKIENDLKLLHPLLEANAIECFGAAFTQGCICE